MRAQIVKPITTSNIISDVTYKSSKTLIPTLHRAIDRKKMRSYI